jgi:RNA-binding protein 25
VAEAKVKIEELRSEINKLSEAAANSGSLDKEKYVIPPHLHDLQEADLPETQRGLVISEIAQFRERAAKREREKQRDLRMAVPVLGAPSGPKMREWGKPDPQAANQNNQQKQQGYGKGAQGYSKPVGFVRGEHDAGPEGQSSRDDPRPKTDEELEEERREARRREEENSFRDVRFLLLVLCCILNGFDSVNVDTNLESERAYRR